MQIKIFTRFDSEIIIRPTPENESEVLDDVREHFKNGWIYIGCGCCVRMGDVKYILEINGDE